MQTRGASGGFRILDSGFCWRPRVVCMPGQAMGGLWTLDSGFWQWRYAGSSDGRTLDSEFWILDFRGGGMPGQAIMARRVVTRQQPSRYARSCKTIHAVPPAGNVLRDRRDTRTCRPLARSAWDRSRCTRGAEHGT